MALYAAIAVIGERIMKKTVLGAVALATLVLASPVVAQELTQWDDVEGWDIMVDPSLGNGCLIQAAYEDGSIVRIGFDRNNESAYVTAFNESWGEIVEGETYVVGFTLDDEPYEGEAKGIYLGGVPGADIAFTNEDFLFDIAKKYTMTLYNGDEQVMAIDLAGSYAALEAAVECQGAQ